VRQIGHSCLTQEKNCNANPLAALNINQNQNTELAFYEAENTAFVANVQKLQRDENVPTGIGILELFQHEVNGTGFLSCLREGSWGYHWTPVHPDG